MKFLRNLLAAILGTIMAFGILFFMLLVFIALASGDEEQVAIQKKSVLVFDIDKPIADYVGTATADPFAALSQSGAGLNEILRAIDVASTDDRIEGMSIENGLVLAGMAQTQEIRAALKRFKEKGKFIYTYGDFYMQKDYYLASVADSVFLSPMGVLDFKGLSSEVLFFKDFQEKTGVKMEVIRHGKYKSAVEPFLSDEMSDANREQLTELLTSLWDAMAIEMAEDRGVSIQNLNTIADTLGGRMPKMAVANGLIDALFYADEYEGLLKAKLDMTDDDDVRRVALSDYIIESKKKRSSSKNKIAVIYAQGEILYGEGGKNYIGQGIINKALKKAREDESVKAVVVRVNSPGGSALTSELIWREMERTKAVKPVVVSMGNVAASGGYYIAAGADKIFAEPTTITGSIGVFGTVPNMTELAKTIGINAEQVGTHKNATEYSLFDPMTETFRANIQEGIEQTYTTFLERVSNGRGITMQEADAIAQGRVWSGTDALRIGLVDAIGNVDAAVNAAAELADITEFSVRNYPKYKSGFEQLLEDLEGASVQLKTNWIKEEVGAEVYEALEGVKSAMQQKGIQARMPFSIQIK